MDVIKCVLVGDYVSEKTKLLIAYTTNKNPIDFVPAAVDNYSVTVMIDGEPYDLTLHDTPSQDDYARLRPLSYPQTNVLLVCFSVVSPASFDNVMEKWVPEITHHCPGTPFLLVGTQIELRDDASAIEHLSNINKRPITMEDGENLAQKLGAVRYMECSIETRIGMKNVFEEAVLAAVNASQSKQSRKGRKCAIV